VLQPPELAAAASRTGRLFHQPLSAQQGAGWCRELDPSYVLEVGEEPVLSPPRSASCREHL
jgi:hypothetical protein